MAANVAINGMGRIGRATFKIILDTPGLELVGINDLVSTDNLAYLLKYDTVYGRYHKAVESTRDSLVVDGKEYRVFNKKDPAELPWKDLDVDLVFECTGVFTDQQGLEKHITAGARHAILSAPDKKGTMDTIVHGVNHPAGGTSVYSCASCTTNCITPVVEIMGRRVGFKKAIMTTIHAYTSTQAIVDSPAGKFRRGRAAAANFVPASTGAAIATTRALPQYEGKFDGVAIRGPVPVGSLADLVFVTEKATSAGELNSIFREESQSSRYDGILGVSEDEIVSSDIIMDPRASIVDLTMTQVVDGDLVKIMSWYDNEWGYSNQMVREALAAVRRE
ncbi:MAG: type I glyceraldehyde-3-phosphate dehydrogenase [Desulfosalsimonas sp.]